MKGPIRCWPCPIAITIAIFRTSTVIEERTLVQERTLLSTITIVTAALPPTSYAILVALLLVRGTVTFPLLGAKMTQRPITGKGSPVTKASLTEDEHRDTGSISLY